MLKGLRSSLIDTGVTVLHTGCSVWIVLDFSSNGNSRLRKTVIFWFSRCQWTLLDESTVGINWWKKNIPEHES